MANFIISVDPDKARREQFARRVFPLLEIESGLVTRELRCGDFYAAWAACSHAPVTTEATGNSAAILWGRAALSGKPVSAADFSKDASQIYDGFYAAVSWHIGNGFAAAADHLGTFPFYFYSEGEVLLAGSSIELFRHHPHFRPALDPRGLAGILLFAHLFDHRPMLRGVRRLRPGCAIAWKPGGPVNETERWKFPGPASSAALPSTEQADEYSAILKRGIDSLLPTDRAWSILLSGGLDSRVTAASMAAERRDLLAVSIGRDTDLDVRCSQLVSRALHLRHHRLDVSADEYVRYARQKAKWEHLSCGFGDVEFTAFASLLRPLQREIASGLLMDAHTSTTLLPDMEGTPINFERAFVTVNRWGFSAEQLARLLRAGIFHDAVDDIVTRSRRIYESFSDDEIHRARCYEFQGRQRYNIGNGFWAWSLGGWPFSPALTTEHTKFIFALPHDVDKPRGYSDELLIRNHPRLARLPMDRNEFNASGLTGPRWTRLSRWLPWLREPVINDITTDHQLRYHRIFDFNSPGWRRIRHAAEPHRHRLYEWFVPEVVNELLPSPDATPQIQRKIPGSGGMKLLLGLMLWLGDDRNIGT